MPVVAVPYRGRMATAADPYPGFAHAEAELMAAASSGEIVKVDAVAAMAILGEVQRLRDGLDAAGRLLRDGVGGAHCWASRQGYGVCEQPGVDGFLAGQSARKTWWKRRR